LTAVVFVTEATDVDVPGFDVVDAESPQAVAQRTTNATITSTIIPIAHTRGVKLPFSLDKAIPPPLTLRFCSTNELFTHYIIGQASRCCNAFFFISR
jgi:hypothetical protein